MRTGQALFLLRIEPDIPRIRPWKELLAAGTQTTWLKFKSFIQAVEYKSSIVKTNRKVEIAEIQTKFKLFIAKLTIYY